jgi:hypothetical protein
VTDTAEAGAAPRHRIAPGSVAEVACIGSNSIAKAVAGTRLLDWPLIAVEDVFLIAAMDDPLSPAAAYGVAMSYLAHLVETGDYTDATVEKVAGLIGRFIKYSERRYGITDVRDLCQEHVLAFIDAPVLGNELRSAAGRTKENRRWAIALFFKTLRGLDLYAGDPLLDAGRAERGSTEFRPLLDIEIERCRKHAPSSRNDTLGPVRVALAEAMAATSEIPEVVVADYDRANARVWLNGSKKRLAGRWARLLPWDLDAIERRLTALDSSDPMTRLAYVGTGDADRREAATAIGLRKVLNRAGLTKEAHPRVRPSSIRAWGAQHLYDETQDIEAVAWALGVQKLDSARRIIGLPQPEADEPPPHRSSR